MKITEKHSYVNKSLPLYILSEPCQDTTVMVAPSYHEHALSNHELPPTFKDSMSYLNEFPVKFC